MVEFIEKNIQKETKNMTYEETANWIMEEGYQTTKGIGIKF